LVEFLVAIQAYVMFRSIQLEEAEIKDNLNGTVHDGARNVLYDRPILFASMVMFKWIQFLVGMLAFEFLGLTVLPAYCAMISAESMKFVLFMTGFILASTHAYYGLPIEADAGGHELIVSFFDMFRLGILNDFNLYELERVSPSFQNATLVENHTTNNTELIGHIGEDKNDYVKSIHYDLRWLSLSIAVGCGVILMNMYIGILGMAYQKYLGNKRAIFTQSRARFVVRKQQRFEFWRRCCRWVLGVSYSSCSVQSGSDSEVEQGGAWLVIPKKYLGEEEEDVSNDSKQLAKIERLMEQMKRNMEIASKSK